MAGRIKHMQRSHRSYRQKDAAYRGFSMRVSASKYNHNTKKSIAESFAGFLALLKLGSRHRNQDK